MPYYGKTVLVTGAAGFIGSHLVRALVHAGAKVIALICKGENPWRLTRLTRQIHLLEADISDRLSLERCLKSVKPKTIFHLAAHTDNRRGFDPVEKALQVNVLGTVNLIRSLAGLEFDVFVFTGSAEEYGGGYPSPLNETYPPKPLSAYSASKSAAMIFCDMLARQEDLPITYIRPFLAYGPAQEDRMFIPQLILSALKGRDFSMTHGKQTREFTYVEDLVDGYMKAGATRKALGEVVNLGTGRDYPLVEVARLTMDLMGNPVRLLTGRVPYRKNEIWKYQCDNSKARQLLNWEPKTDLRTGLKKTIQWYESHFHNT